MAMKNKNKISDAQLLQIEKQRLKEICALHEAKLKAHIVELRDHSFNMAMHSVLPFETGTRNKIIGVIELMNETVFPVLFGISFGKEKGTLTKNFMKLAQGMMIALSFKVFRKIFSRKKTAAVRKDSFGETPSE